jgi:hypothetical protein
VQIREWSRCGTAFASISGSGESLEHYQSLRQAIFADLAPRSAIEWLLVIDVAEL